MCNFFSFKTDGNKKIFYFSAQQRKDKVTYPDGQTIDNYDSHTAIETYYGLKDTDWSSGEYDPFTDKLVIDQQNTTWDDEKVRGMLATVDWNTLCGDVEGVRKFISDLKTIQWFKPDGTLEESDTIKVFETRAAAWAAARDAAGDAALYCNISFVCKGLNIDKQHIAHIDERFEVWKRGYGVLRDVNGVLYCYKEI